MGDFIIRNVRIHDNGDHVFNPDQDPIFNLDGNPVQEPSSDVQTFLNELGVHSLSDIRGRSLPDLSRYQHFIAMGGRYLERNEFHDAALNFLSAAEMANHMSLPAADMFRQIVGVFEQRRTQATYDQIASIRQAPRHGFASSFLALQLIQEMPDSIPGRSRHVWGPEIKRDLFVFFHRELMSVLQGELGVLENGLRGLPQIDRLWDASRQLEQISAENFPEQEARDFSVRIEYVRRRLALLGARTSVQQAEEMLRDPWTHPENLAWIRQRLEIYQAFQASHPQDVENTWWVSDAVWSRIEGLKSRIDSKITALVQRESVFSRVANMDEAGSAHVGTIWYMRQVHADPNRSSESLRFPVDAQVRYTAMHRLENFRELRNLHLRIGTQNPLHIFVEGLSSRVEEISGLMMRALQTGVRQTFPQGMPRDNLSDDQIRFLYGMGPAFLYRQFYPNVELHGTEPQALDQDFTNLANSYPGVVGDYRESNASFSILRHLERHPGQEVALQFGMAHRYWDDLDRLFRGSILPMPRTRSICWSSPALEALGPGGSCPAFSE